MYNIENTVKTSKGKRIQLSYNNPKLLSLLDTLPGRNKQQNLKNGCYFFWGPGEQYANPNQTTTQFASTHKVLILVISPKILRNSNVPPLHLKNRKLPLKTFKKIKNILLN